LDLWLFSIRWGHQRDWLTVCQGEFFGEFLVTMVIIQDPHRYLPAVSDQGDGYVDSFGHVDLWTRFYQAIFHSEGALQLSHHHLLAL
jgi:hypothetical protein